MEFNVNHMISATVNLETIWNYDNIIQYIGIFDAEIS